MRDLHTSARSRTGKRGAATFGIRAFALTALTALTAALLAAAPVQAQPVSAVAQGQGSMPLRDVRYCELLPLSIGFSGITAQVFNTLGHSDCPEANWQSLTGSELRTAFDTLYTVRNGPRFFLMDQIIASGATLKGEVVTVNGITLEKRAELQIPVSALRGSPYQETTIDRSTVYRFDAGKPVFQLTAPDGAVYVMQSYAQIVDPGLTYAGLPGLGAKLQLPAGWTYAMRTPTEDLIVSATGKATVVQDDLKNTYQKIIPR